MLIQTEFRNAAPAPTADFDADLLAVLAQSRPSAVTLHAPNSVIYAQGETAGPLYLVEFGAVRLCRLTADGRRQIGAFHFAGEVFGFEADGEHHFYAEAIESAGIRVLRPNINGGHVDGMFHLALKSLTRAQEHLLVLGRQNAVERMAAFLIDLADRQGSDSVIALPMQRCDIGDYLGLTFETVSRVIRKLKQERLIRLNSVREIEILDLAGLEGLCG